MAAWLAEGKVNMKENSHVKDKANGNGSGSGLKFNYVKRETLPQTRIDVRALGMFRAHLLYIKGLMDHATPIGEVLIKILSTDTDFVEWLGRQLRAEPFSEQNNNSTPAQSAKSSSE